MTFWRRGRAFRFCGSAAGVSSRSAATARSGDADGVNAAVPEAFGVFFVHFFHAGWREVSDVLGRATSPCA